MRKDYDDFPSTDKRFESLYCDCSFCGATLTHQTHDQDGSRVIMILEKGLQELCKGCWDELNNFYLISGLPILTWTQRLQDFIDARRLFAKH